MNSSSFQLSGRGTETTSHDVVDGLTNNNNTTTKKQQQQQQQQQEDEWIFSMQLPRHCVGPNTKNNKKMNKNRMIQMRQSQPQQPPLQQHQSHVVQHTSSPPPPSSAAAAAAASSLRKDDIGSNDDDKQQQQQQEIEIELVVAAQERTFLLAKTAAAAAAAAAAACDHTTPTPTSTARQTTAAATSSSSTGGWTLQSPYWSIQSDIILQVTYRPAWQGLPEFTNMCQACGKCSSSTNSSSSSTSNSNNNTKMHGWTRNALSAAVVATAAAGGVLCCGCLLGNSSGDNDGDLSSKIDFMTHTWTIHDIVSVQEMTDYNANIPGIGSCRAIQVELKPLRMDQDHDDHDLFNVPPLLQPAWERHVQEMLHARLNNQSTKTTTRQRLTTTRSTSGGSSGSGTSNIDLENEKNNHTAKMDTTTTSNKNDDDDKGPTLIFCLPNHHVDPPLLWKVDFPPLTRNTAIAVETITVLEGALILAHQGQKQQQQQVQQLQQTPPGQQTPPLRQQSSDASATAAPRTSSFASNDDDRLPLVQHHPVNNNNKTIHPTHIYITGYQSWSFAGSVARGCKQPTSALPKVFSRAFNLGGTPPPMSSIMMMTTPPTTTTTRPTTIGGDNHDDNAATAALVDEGDNDKDGNYNGDDVRLDDDDEEDKPLPPVSEYYQGRETKDAAFYQSDFFTCITSDGGQRQQEELVDNVAVTTTATTHLDERGGPAILLGWLSQHEQFGVITADKSLQQFAMHASAHGQIILPTSTTTGKMGVGLTTDWAYVQLISPHSYDEEPMVHYLHSVAAYNQARPLQNGPLLTGWCSWYHYYENISESNLRENFAKLAGMRTKVPTNVAVVDDGYMTAWGDWHSLKLNRFSNTLEIVSRDIEAQGMRPGLWLAPFAADKHSKLVQEHPDWIIRNDRGIPANSSYCGKFFYGLDATNPAVREYVYECIRRAVHDWKFNVLKIDFLYAACLHGNGKYDLSMSRAQAMHLALQTIRDAAGPDVFLIGCGCPLAVGIGYVDGMRISADTGPTWKPAPPLPSWDNGTLPCLRSMVRNSLSRAPLGHRWWHNDPDCLLLGTSTRLSDEEVATAASIIAMTCGMMLLSDDLTNVSPSRMRILTKIFPMVGATAVVLDLHSTASEGLPSLLRLWCSDKYNLVDAFRESFELEGGGVSSHSKGRDHNAEATFYARAASFQFDVEVPTSPNERKRSCIHVTKGLGTWTVVSISNWSDKAEVVHVPELALLPPPFSGFEGGESDSFLDMTGNIQDKGCNGYHIFAFWSSKYSWLPDQTRHSNDDNGNGNGGNVEHDCSADYTLSKRLAPHETEIFHIKPVTPDRPQYIGSDIHFSCGQEVRSFRATAHSMQICLKTDYKRVGHIFVFIPRIQTDSNSVQVTVSGKPGRGVAVGNTPSFQKGGGVGARSPRLVGRVLCIQVVVHADGSPTDGHVNVEF